MTHNDKKRPHKDITNSSEIEEAEGKGGRHLEAAAADITKYVRKLRVLSENEPGLLFNWDNDSLTKFIANAAVTDVERPAWLTAAGVGSIEAFKADVVAHLAEGPRRSFGSVLVAPNTAVQYVTLTLNLAWVETDAFVQAAMVGLPKNAVLAKCAIITKKSMVKGVPLKLVAPPAPARVVFA